MCGCVMMMMEPVNAGFCGIYRFLSAQLRKKSQHRTAEKKHKIEKLGVHFVFFVYNI